jgi:hypothetical protein
MCEKMVDSLFLIKSSSLSSEYNTIGQRCIALQLCRTDILFVPLVIHI